MNLFANVANHLRTRLYVILTWQQCGLVLASTFTSSHLTVLQCLEMTDVRCLKILECKKCVQHELTSSFRDILLWMKLLSSCGSYVHRSVCDKLQLTLLVRFHVTFSLVTRESALLIEQVRKQIMWILRRIKTRTPKLYFEIFYKWKRTSLFIYLLSLVYFSQYVFRICNIKR